MPHNQRDDTTDDLMLRRALGGDRTALEGLLRPHLPRLRAYVYRHLDLMVSARESSADIVQSACREVVADIRSFDDFGEGVDAFRRWLFRTALRKIQDRRRHYRRVKRDAEREILQRTDHLLDFCRKSSTPSGQAIGKEERARVRTALIEMDDGYREVIELSYFGGLTHGEIAERKGKSLAAVHSLMARAMARLALTMKRRPSD